MSRPLVVARIRPLSADDKAKGVVQRVVKGVDATGEPVVQIYENPEDPKPNATVVVTHVFDEEASNDELYGAFKEFLESFLDRTNITLFAYGETGSGKTYTMSHITRHFLYDIFDRQDQFKSLELSLSIIEIDNEQIYDLVTPKRGDPLKISGYHVQGCKWVTMTRKDMVDSTLEEAWKRRKTAATSYNAVSSRSHAVCSIKMKCVSLEGMKFDSFAYVVDLAGSERTGKAAQDGNPNQSLSTLQRVVRDIVSGKNKRPAFRDSKLTHLLQPSLTGLCRLGLVFTLRPESFLGAKSSANFAHDTMKMPAAKIKKNAVQMTQAQLQAASEALMAREEAAMEALEQERRNREEMERRNRQLQQELESMRDVSNNMLLENQRLKAELEDAQLKSQQALNDKADDLTNLVAKQRDALQEMMAHVQNAPEQGKVLEASQRMADVMDGIQDCIARLDDPATAEQAMQDLDKHMAALEELSTGFADALDPAAAGGAEALKAVKDALAERVEPAFLRLSLKVDEMKVAVEEHEKTQRALDEYKDMIDQLQAEKEGLSEKAQAQLQQQAEAMEAIQKLEEEKLTLKEEFDKKLQTEVQERLTALESEKAQVMSEEQEKLREAALDELEKEKAALREQLQEEQAAFKAQMDKLEKERAENQAALGAAREAAGEVAPRADPLGKEFNHKLEHLIASMPQEKAFEKLNILFQVSDSFLQLFIDLGGIERFVEVTLKGTEDSSIWAMGAWFVSRIRHPEAADRLQALEALDVLVLLVYIRGGVEQDIKRIAALQAVRRLCTDNPQHKKWFIERLLLSMPSFVRNRQPEDAGEGARAVNPALNLSQSHRGTESETSSLIGLLSARNQAVQEAAALTLAELASGEGAVSAKEAVAKAQEVILQQQGVEKLMLLLQQQDIRVKVAAMKALGRLVKRSAACQQAVCKWLPPDLQRTPALAESPCPGIAVLASQLAKDNRELLDATAQTLLHLLLGSPENVAHCKQMCDDGQLMPEAWSNLQLRLLAAVGLAMCSSSVTDPSETGKVQEIFPEDDAAFPYYGALMAGRWEDGSSGGNSAALPLFHRNPQYHLQLDSPAQVAVVLEKGSDTSSRKAVLNLLCYRASSQDPSAEVMHEVQFQKVAGKADRMAEDHVVMLLPDLEPGRYILVPCHNTPGRALDYKLSVVSSDVLELEDIAHLQGWDSEGCGLVSMGRFPAASAASSNPEAMSFWKQPQLLVEFVARPPPAASGSGGDGAAQELPPAEPAPVDVIVNVNVLGTGPTGASDTHVIVNASLYSKYQGRKLRFVGETPSTLELEGVAVQTRSVRKDKLPLRATATLTVPDTTDALVVIPSILNCSPPADAPMPEYVISIFCSRSIQVTPLADAHSWATRTTGTIDLHDGTGSFILQVPSETRPAPVCSIRAFPEGEEDRQAAAQVEVVPEPVGEPALFKSQQMPVNLVSWTIAPLAGERYRVKLSSGIQAPKTEVQVFATAPASFEGLDDAVVEAATSGSVPTHTGPRMPALQSVDDDEGEFEMDSILSSKFLQEYSAMNQRLQEQVKAMQQEKAALKVVAGMKDRRMAELQQQLQAQSDGTTAGGGRELARMKEELDAERAANRKLLHALQTLGRIRLAGSEGIDGILASDVESTPGMLLRKAPASSAHALGLGSTESGAHAPSASPSPQHPHQRVI